MVQDRDIIERLLEEQKTEREHQLNFIKGLQTTYDELNKQGWRPLESLLQLINTWKQNLSLVERQIKALEELLKSK